MLYLNDLENPEKISSIGSRQEAIGWPSEGKILSRNHFSKGAYFVFKDVLTGDDCFNGQKFINATPFINGLAFVVNLNGDLLSIDGLGNFKKIELDGINSFSHSLLTRTIEGDLYIRTNSMQIDGSFGEGVVHLIDENSSLVGKISTAEYHDKLNLKEASSQFLIGWENSYSSKSRFRPGMNKNLLINRFNDGSLNSLDFESGFSIDFKDGFFSQNGNKFFKLPSDIFNLFLSNYGNSKGKFQKLDKNNVLSEQDSSLNLMTDGKLFFFGIVDRSIWEKSGPKDFRKTFLLDDSGRILATGKDFFGKDISINIQNCSYMLPPIFSFDKGNDFIVYDYGSNREGSNDKDYGRQIEVFKKDSLFIEVELNKLSNVMKIGTDFFKIEGSYDRDHIKNVLKDNTSLKIIFSKLNLNEFKRDTDESLVVLNGRKYKKSLLGI